MLQTKKLCPGDQSVFDFTQKHLFSYVFRAAKMENAFLRNNVSSLARPYLPLGWGGGLLPQKSSRGVRPPSQSHSLVYDPNS